MGGLYDSGIARKAARHGAHVGGNDGRYIQQGYDRHVADLNPDGDRRGRPNLASVMERNDLDEFLALAELSDRDFTAERRGAVVVSVGGEAIENEGGGAEAVEAQREERKRVEALHADQLKVPRRPPWTKSMAADELDRNERRHFLEWRRALANVEADERLTLTPFEKNLEIWRQLWRVCERSDIVVQVVDARDPLFYRCPDLEAYVKEISAKKRTMLLLNKADLLSPELRRAWADHFDEQGISYLWWSAKAATEEVEAEVAAAKEKRLAEEAAAAGAIVGIHGVLGRDDEEDDEEDDAAAALGRPLPASTSGSVTMSGSGARDKAAVLTRQELLDVLEARASEAAGEGARDQRRDGRVVVGMVGYPNVGKSSTVNALVAEKKTGVSATPGKTKHFQTLELGDGLLLADCPGLVFPSFTASRAELVCNGVLPVDRLTDVRQPIAVVAERIPRRVFEATYKLKLPLPALHEAQNRNATAGELLRAYCAARGLTVQHGRPDDQRAGRAILKDFINGKLLYCVGPKGYEGKLGVEGGGGAIGNGVDFEEADGAVFNGERGGASGSGLSRIEGDGGEGRTVNDVAGLAPDDPLAAQLLEEMMAELGTGKNKPEKPKRAEHKFQKKSKVKGRIKYAGVGEDQTAGGNGFKMGKKGGLMPVHVQSQVRSSITDER